MQEILLDGCVYDMEHNVSTMYNQETVTVWTKEEDLVAIVTVHHNEEFADVVYKLDKGEYDDSPYPYFDFDTANPTATATWAVATHPAY